MKNKLYLFFSILFCLATLFMGVGYASINSISLNISGEVIAQAQEGIFITEVKYNDELSNNVSVDDSKINSAYQTNLDSSIVLSNNNDSQITYDITIYNSYDLAYVFDGIEYTVGENTYSNENITYKLTNLVEGNTVNSNDDISFSITFYFKDSSNISDVKLKSLLNFKFSLASYVVDTFEYTGDYETFTVPHTGTYKIELWGAQGGSGSADEINYIYSGGLGAYTSGIISLKENTQLYIYVGEEGIERKYNIESLSRTTFNGGGAGGYDDATDKTSDTGGSGGGATDIRYNGTTFNDRIMVAAGGGGGAWESQTPYEGQNGGGLYVKGLKIHGYHEIITVSDGTQNSGYSFGIGENGYAAVYTASKGGGGGGYWSGKVDGNNTQGAGGVSYISGHTGCIAIASKDSTTSRIGNNNTPCTTGTTDNICSIHYSQYYFTDTIMIDGGGYNWTTERGSLVGMPTHDGTGSMTGNTGNGYAKITFISEFE